MDRSRPLTRTVFHVVLVIFAIIYLYPFVIQVATSFKSDPQANANPLSIIPNPVELNAWKRIFGLTPDSSVPILHWAFNSALVTVLVTAGRVFFDSLAGYALSRLRFRGRGFLFTAVLAVMSVPGVALLIPKFLVTKYFGIYNTYYAMVLPLIVDAAGVFIMKQFFDTVPVTIEEAARLDGASIFQTFWHVVLPMARPALITLTILSFQGSWNEFSHFLVTTQSPQYQTLITGLASLSRGTLGSGTQYPLKMATALLTTIPVAILFFVFQRHLVRGANEGAVKG
ncbi:carbohydrate ABC transporter permease [Arsenicicoccus piscis]|uniref:Sn-glycerol-3-phosphate transport system permease protein UgpE n=1 Tax=Arsenicicoccus piscis TaxID=673954 RepID=A0ABQ6HMG5_9MICO|nr:carbohydrate ABC transporter permease [Arsenicicoccus piscis]MCH8628907.1 carbohydrate ABC transporter permease [Arsenicicoccus piscis]GMA19512.1 sn-glycerol-3-phosphate transport system permease protein UgpE [Arsenicicoccus piscis]